MCNIIILRSGSQSLCKRFSLDGEMVKSQRASMPAYFTCESQVVDGIDAFARLLTDLEQDRSRFIVRVKLADDVDKDKPVRRRLSRPDRSEPNESPFLDASAPWVMIDVDKLVLPEGLSEQRRCARARPRFSNNKPGIHPLALLNAAKRPARSRQICIASPPSARRHSVNRSGSAASHF
jgi:hypothetical protein